MIGPGVRGVHPASISCRVEVSESEAGAWLEIGGPESLETRAEADIMR